MRSSPLLLVILERDPDRRYVGLANTINLMRYEYILRVLCALVVIYSSWTGVAHADPPDTIATTESPFACHIIGVQHPVANVPGKQGHVLCGDTPALQWAAQHVVEELGSDIIKLGIASRHLKAQGFEVEGKPTLTELAGHPVYRRALALPYRAAFFWAHGRIPFGYYTPRKESAVYDEFYAFTKHLLTEYNNSGKTFMIGNWEGDWLLGAKAVPDGDCDDETIARMISWMNARGKAVADAVRDIPHDNVRVHFYIEINHVRQAREDGLKRMVNSVLPHTKYTDYVSVSSYETQGIGQWKSPQNAASLRETVLTNLDYVEQHLPPRPIGGKRVGIGEIGFPIVHIMQRYKVDEAHAELIQARMALENAMVNLEWGVPFWLWWQLLNNEPNHQARHDLNFLGFGLIDQDTARRRRLWHEMEAYNDGARNAANLGLSQEGFRPYAIKWLAKRVARLRAEEQAYLKANR